MSDISHSPDGRESIQSQILDLERKLANLSDVVCWSHDNLFRQMEAFTSLLAWLQPRRPLPPTRGWAMSPDSLICLVDLVLDRVPETFVEFGSGTSTLILAYTIEKAGRGRLVTFEHRKDGLQSTRERIAAHGLSDVVQVCYAPLADGGDGDQWYDRQAVSDGLPHVVDMVLIDGPPANVHPEARRPALRALADRLAPGATICLDDADRQGERRTLKAWSEEFSVSFKILATEKGLAVGRWR